MTALRDNACMTNTEFLLQKGGDLINSELDGRGAMEVKSALNELLLLLLQLEDLLLDGVLHDQSIHQHLPTLPNSEHAIDGLILHRFVPPRITQEPTFADVKFRPTPPARSDTSRILGYLDETPTLGFFAVGVGEATLLFLVPASSSSSSMVSGLTSSVKLPSSGVDED